MDLANHSRHDVRRQKAFPGDVEIGGTHRLEHPGRSPNQAGQGRHPHQDRRHCFCESITSKLNALSAEDLPQLLEARRLREDLVSNIPE